MRKKRIRQERDGCPVAGCKRTKLPWQVMCAPHWHRIPKRDQSIIWSLYYTARGSLDHKRAVLRAVAYVNGLEAETREWSETHQLSLALPLALNSGGEDAASDEA